MLHLKLDECSHFVAWDGEVIHDIPFSLKISNVDRKTAASSQAAFRKLYQEYESLKLTAVYRLYLFSVCDS